MAKLSYTVGGEAPTEPVEIEIGGTDTSGNPVSREFRCIGHMPDILFMDVMGRLERARQTMSGMFVATADAIDFVETCIVDEQRPAFHDFVRDPAVRVSSELVQRIFNDLVEVYADRPTDRSSGSGNGQSPTPVTSTAVPPSDSSPPPERLTSNGSATLSTA